MALVLRDIAEKSSHLNCLILALAKMAGYRGLKCPMQLKMAGIPPFWGLEGQVYLSK
jgi:hypothetical protein